jgi:hypothetical protein
LISLTILERANKIECFAFVSKIFWRPVCVYLCVCVVVVVGWEEDSKLTKVKMCHHFRGWHAELNSKQKFHFLRTTWLNRRLHNKLCRDFTEHKMNKFRFRQQKPHISRTCNAASSG